MKNPDTKYEANNRLIARAQTGDEDAWRELIELNSSLVYNLATWHYVHVTSKVPLQELIANGISSLFFAVEKFDPSLGYQFSTYATWWIKQSFGRSHETLGGMYIPVHAYELARSLPRVQSALETSLGRPCTLQELADATGESVSMILALRRALASVSLDKPVLGDEVSIGGMVADEEGTVEEQVIRQEEHQIVSSCIESLLGTLKRRERQVIELMYFDEMNLSQISELYGVSPQMVSLIKIRAMRKLRAAAAKQQIAS